MSADFTDRYRGLVEQARQLNVQHEDIGWRLANVLGDAVDELKALGRQVWSHEGDRNSPHTAIGQVAADTGLSVTKVTKYVRTWRKFGAPAKRYPDLTFIDHLVIISNADVESVISHRARINAKRLGNSPPPPTESGSTRSPYASLTSARAFLRRVQRADVWDFPDHQRALSYLADIQGVVDALLAKPWGESSGQSGAA